MKIKFDNWNFEKLFGNGIFIKKKKLRIGILKMRVWKLNSKIGILESYLKMEVLKIGTLKNYLRMEVLKIKFENWNFGKLFED